MAEVPLVGVGGGGIAAEDPLSVFEGVVGVVPFDGWE
jgi:hypothetical protein